MSDPSLFDPARYAPVRRPLLDASGLPADCYRDERFFQRELAQVFGRGWLMLGREDMVPERGDFFTVDHAGAALIVLRDHDGRVRALHNVCRHRGARLVDVPAGAATGRTASIVCPYHAWSFALDGSLRACVGMEDTRAFDKADWPLAAARCETWAGFVWVSLDDAAPPLLDWLGELPERLAPYRLQDMVATRVVTHDVECNWKTWVENFMEGYHIPTVHRSTISKLKAVNHPEEPRGNGQYTAIFEQHDGTLALLPGDAGFPPIEGLDGESVRGSRFMLVYPTTMFALTVDAMWCFQCLPLAPERTRIVHTSLFPRSRTARPDFEALAANYYKRQDRVVKEDNDIAAWQQRGLRSPMARPGRFATKERIVHALDNWILDRVLGE
ncbi:aromatic ring-hydroxylating dioxygenase subunit alpha [Aquabacterium sp. J223]|uniref:aromatic ring-hydroxylating oxygenase subunit alpha n=1 Tax=Aquabacterium sp. J223 TaxID=2898431 RepID=UPI0021ADD0D2|nr:aromatic ring-hydroxylating dioxygenase subunit alpha [Aquabacterium sp. J223]UUX95409.1 aromatic ring-hydroxylating dioxygenase subunit alpha [Aquabacterium sp. J223]